MIKIFVYGTLRKGDSRSFMLSDNLDAKYIKDIKTKPLYTLVDVGMFPALCKEFSFFPSTLSSPKPPITPTSKTPTVATMAAVACLKGKCHMVITRPTLHNRNELRLELQKCCVFIKLGWIHTCLPAISW